MPSTMDIDPAALTSKPTISTTPILPPAKLLANLPSAKKASVPARIDLEPFYAALKSAIGEHWPVYKEAVSLFMMGQLNQAELSSRIDWFLSTPSGETEHLHNQFIAAIYANVTREMPDNGVASWVSTNDKPTSGAGSKPVSGDAAERRLKSEVMQLPSRDRRRIKEINLNDVDPFEAYANVFGEHRRSKVRMPDAVPASAGGLNKTNWDLEIRKRFAQPLAVESGEFPDVSTIETRMLPLCYESGLVTGHAPDAAQFVSVATETFIKEVLSQVFSKTRSNGPGMGSSAYVGDWIMTHKYRRQLEKEEDALSRGEVQRDKSDLLPIESKAAGERGSLGMADMRLAMELGDCGLGQMKVILQEMNSGYREGELELLDDYSWPEGYNLHTKDEDGDLQMGGTAPSKLTNGVKTDPETDDYGWEGASLKDRMGLDSLLDSCLTG